MNKFKSILLLALAGLTVFILMNYAEFFTLEYLQQSSERLQSLYSDNPLQTVVVYVLVYIIAVALSISSKLAVLVLYHTPNSCILCKLIMTRLILLSSSIW